MRLARGWRWEGRPSSRRRIDRLAATEKNTWIEMVVPESRPRALKAAGDLIRHSLLKISRVRLGGLSFEGLDDGRLARSDQGRDLRPARPRRPRPDAPRAVASSRDSALPPRLTRVIEPGRGRRQDREDRTRADLGFRQDRRRRAGARARPPPGSRSCRPAARRARSPRPASRCARSATSPARPRSSTGGSRRCTRASTAASSAAPTAGAPRRDAGGRHRPDRPRGREPLSVPRDRRARARRSTRSIENIDIGGPSMIRSAAKNHERVAVVVDPGRLRGACSPSSTRGGEISAATRFRLARKAFAHTAAYDGAIAAHLRPVRRRRDARAGRLPRVAARRRHAGARAALRREPAPEGGVLRGSTAAPRRPVAGARARCCRARSSRTTTCSTSTRRCASCASSPSRPRSIVKHNNPCGAAVGATSVADAYRRARETDPVSAFGGIVARQPRRRRRAGARARARRSSSA